MSIVEAVIEGTLQADGTLLLDRKPALRPGRVRIVLMREGEIEIPKSDQFWQRMQAIWDAQAAAGVVPRTVEQIDAEQRAMRRWLGGASGGDRADAARAVRRSTIPRGSRIVTIYLDTNIVIYFVERNPSWHAKVVARLAKARLANDLLAVGDLTRAECLVGPFRSSDATLQASYAAFFTDPEIGLLPITSAICERAARIRAAHNLEMIDALHLATAAEHGCGLFLTNDAKLSRCTAIAVEVLV